ncbi:MAG: hypothetical protein VX210_09250 [Myxococcota bacterium]|nr:hypothetical protein [Myxococcota bacterium]
MGIGRLETSENAASTGSVSEEGLAQTLVRLREAVVGEDWDGLQELWVKLPADFQSSRAGRGIWAGMKRGIGEFNEAAQLYFELYKSECEPHYLKDAILAAIDAENWVFAGLLTEYLVQRRDYAFMLPDFLGRLSSHIRLDELYIFHCCADARLPSCLMAWNLPETERLRIALVDCFTTVATLETSPKNISALATAAVSLNEKARALDRIRGLNVDIGPKWVHLANLQYQLNAPEEARVSYLKAMDADSSLDEVIPTRSNQGTPLVLLHRGPADFIGYALQSLRLCHPDRRIILISDDYHRYDGSLNIEYRQWSRYNRGAKQLAHIYRHQSENKYAFELLCLERWLILEEFCAVEDIDRLIHLDTDILSFGDFYEVEALLEDNVSATCGTSPHVAVMNRTDITSMAELIGKFYDGSFKFPEGTDLSNVSDMNFIAYLSPRLGWRNLHDLPIDGKIDHHLRSSNGYRMDHGLKSFEFVDGRPFATSKDSGQQDRFLFIHFQGSSKQHIAPFFRRAFGDSISV